VYPPFKKKKNERGSERERERERKREKKEREGEGHKNKKKQSETRADKSSRLVLSKYSQLPYGATWWQSGWKNQLAQ
jgi:hypothetical protein